MSLILLIGVVSTLTFGVLILIRMGLFEMDVSFEFVKCLTWIKDASNGTACYVFTLGVSFASILDFRCTFKEKID